MMKKCCKAYFKKIWKFLNDLKNNENSSLGEKGAKTLNSFNLTFVWQQDTGTPYLSSLWLGAIKGYEPYQSKVEMGSDPTRAYFWPSVNKKSICLWLSYFLTRPEEIFF